MKKINVNRAKFEVEPETRVPKKGKAVVCITTGEIFKSAKEAADHYGLEYTSVTECCAGKLLSVGGGKGTRGKGLKFSYITDLAYKVNDVTDYIKELKAQAEATAEREARIEAAKAQLMEMISHFNIEANNLLTAVG